jgi:hypothetical protein
VGVGVIPFPKLSIGRGIYTNTLYFLYKFYINFIYPLLPPMLQTLTSAGVERGVYGGGYEPKRG